MKKFLGKHKHKILFTILGLLVLMLIIVGLVYGSNFKDPTSSSLKKFFPAKIVGRHIVSVYDLGRAQEVSKKIDSVGANEVAERLVRVERMRNLARELNINLKLDDVSDELTYFKKGNEEDYQKLLKDYFSGSEADFTKLVAYPQAWEAIMRTYYNADVSTNSKNFIEAQNILSRIEKGEKFEDLAKALSDDKITGQLGGDLGFIEHGQIIPELEDQATVSTIGEVHDRVVVTRLGYHIIYPVETSTQDGKKLWHIKHILIQNDGFEQWLDDQTRNIKVWSILN